MGDKISLEQAFINIGEQIGAQSVAYKILVASLHQDGLIDGRVVAQNLRLFETGSVGADDYLKVIAEALREQIEACEANGPQKLSAVSIADAPVE